MNGLICLLVFCLLAVTALAALGLCRRLFSHELPEHMATLACIELDFLEIATQIKESELVFLLMQLLNFYDVMN